MSDEELTLQLEAFRIRNRENALKGIYPFDWNGISRQSDWSDDIFFTNYYKPAALQLRKEINIDTSVNIATFFLSLYLGCNDIPPNVTLQDIYFSLLPSIKIGGKYLFDSQQATKEPDSFSTPVKNVSSFQFFKCSSPQKSYSTPNGVFIFSAVKIDKWFKNMLAAAEDPAKKQDFINMVGFIMLNMLRLLRNEDDSLDKHLPMGAYRSFMKIFKSFHEVKDFPFPPPHAKFYDIFHHYLSLNHDPSKHILAILVQTFITSKEDIVLSFLNAACLQHFYGHGVGAINWSSKLTEKIGMELNDVLSCFVWEDVSISVEKIQLFMSKTQPKSWPWSRFFDQAAYYSLSTAKNTRFCLICAYAVIDDHEKIPRMPQFRKIAKLIFNTESMRAENLLHLLQHKRTN